MLVVWPPLSHAYLWQRDVLQARGSTLAAWFSGRWEDCLDHDEQGRTFLDFDPDLFKPILSFLRSSAISSSTVARPRLAGVDASKQQAFKELIKYLALEEYLGYGCDNGLQPSSPTSARASAPIYPRVYDPKYCGPLVAQDPPNKSLSTDPQPHPGAPHRYAFVM